MKHIVFLLALSLFSLNAYSETCTGISGCTSLYEKLTGKTINTDKAISDEMTLTLNETTLTKENAAKEFAAFINMNAVTLEGSSLKAMRNGEYLTAPIYLVTVDNVPQMINKDGLVTMVYQATKPTQRLVTKNIRALLSKKKAKSRQGIAEYNSNMISVSDTYEHAEKVIRAILKNDMKNDVK